MMRLLFKKLFIGLIPLFVSFMVVGILNASGMIFIADPPCYDDAAAGGSQQRLCEETTPP